MTPDQFTLEERMLDVGDGHRLYAQIWGNKDAPETIVFLHGGPGSGCSDGHKGLFNPATQRVLFWDQRGCGKSLPHGSLKANNTDVLVDDINALTQAFAIDRFAITGGSWGSCLALVYGIRHPERVTRMVLRGIFTGRQREIDFLDKGKLRSFFPEAWESFASSASDDMRGNPSDYHLPRVLGEDPDAAKKSAYAYACLEGAVISLDDRFTPEDFGKFDPAGTIIECSYLANNCYLPEGYILENAHKLTMPVSLIQGRYDAVCPPFTAYELAKVLPDGKLYWTVAGHSGRDRANWDLTRALLGS